MQTYNHAYDIGFSVSGSVCADGKDVTAPQIRAAIVARLDNLSDDELLEAVGLFDTYSE